MSTRSKFLLMLLAGTSLLHAQMWQQNDQIFNPSGIPSLSFSQPRFADLDSDDDFDMILGNISGTPLYFENTGSRTNPHFQAGDDIFASIQALDCEIGVCIDLDGDADLDFITGGYTGLQLYKNTGTAFGAVFERLDGFFDNLNPGINPVPHFSDLDADGDYDMVLGASESGVVKFYENFGSPDSASFVEAEAIDWFDVGLYAYPWFSDLDADGDSDLLIGRDGFGFFYYNNVGFPSSWEWSDASSQFNGLGGATYWNSPCLVDLSGDGKQDLVHGTAFGPLKYYKNTGTLAQASWQEVNSLFGGVLDVGGASNPVFIDFDNDGDYDLLSGSQLGSIKYFENTGNEFGPAWNANHSLFSSIDHSIYSSVAAGDLDDDGLVDLVVGDLSGNLYYHHNTGGGFTFESGKFSGVSGGGWSSPRLYDIDSDGDLDLFIGREDGGISYFENTGTAAIAQWTEDINLFAGFDIGSNTVISFGLFNDDLKLDLITGNISHEIQFFSYENGQWVEHAEIVTGITAGQNATPALVDLDGDGDLDLTVGNYDGTFSYFENLNIVGTQDAPVLPGISILHPAYPNPFNPATRIYFDSHQSASVSLTIYDLSGRVVQTLLNGAYPQGSYAIDWSGTDSRGLEVDAGVYLVVLDNGLEKQTQKITYLK